MLLDEANYDYLKLGPLVSLNRSELRDAWGQNIVFNNVLKVYSATEKDACVPEGGYPETPPYTMMLQSISPWGLPITVCPIQPVN